jgi:hypothetical protein
MRFLIVAFALSACGGGSSPHTKDASISIDGSASTDSAQLCVDTINAYRATLSLPPYARWNEEESCAGNQAKSDSQSGTAHGAFGTCNEHAQDECPGWPGPPTSMITGCLAQMWAEGPGSDFAAHGHYINMSSTSYTKVACGFYTLPDGSVWAAQDFL